MLSDENDGFVRDYEVPSGITLMDFHDFICKDLHYNSNSMASFFTSDREWNKLAEFTSVDMDGQTRNMAEVKLAEVIHNDHDRLIYQFDLLSDRSMYLEMINSHKGELAEPRTLLSEGEAPDQFEPSENIGAGSIFDDIMSDFGEFEGGDDYSDDNY